MATISTELLPTRGQYYPQPTKELNVEPLNLDGLALMSEACTEDSADIFVEAIKTCLPHTDVNALPLSDFIALAAYIRIQTFTNSPLEVRYTCTAPRYTLDGNTLSREEVEALESVEGVQVRDCNNHVHKEFKFEDLEMVKLPEDFHLEDTFDVPRAKHYAEYVNLYSNAQYRKLIPAVVWLKEGDTLKDKLEIVRSQPNLDLFDELSKLNSMHSHGLKRFLTVNCSLCNAPHKTALQISQYSFFR